MRGLKRVRLPEYDYQTDGYYFVTIVTRQRRDLLRNQDAIIKKELADLVRKIKGVSVDVKVIMPNHIHLIFILSGSALPLGEIVRQLKAKISRHFGFSIWQPNYYEHVVRDEGALNRIREYIIHNPELEVLRFDQFYKPSR